MDDVKHQDPSISGANSSTAPPKPQDSLTLPLHNAIADASPVEDNCNEETLTAPRLPAAAQPPIATTHLTGNRNHEAVFTDRHLGVGLDDQSYIPSFQLTRSPTISFGDSGETPFQVYRYQLDSSSDEDEDKSETGIAELATNPTTSPSLPSCGDDTCIESTPSSFLRHSLSQEDSSFLTDTSDNFDQPSDDQGPDIARASLQSSKTQNTSLQPTHRSGLSVITDAGDQQFKRQKRASDREGAVSREQCANQEKFTSQEWAESFPSVPCSPEYADLHELNCQLFAALQQTRDPRDKGFLPKGQLDKLINPDSVFRELSKSLSQTLSWQHIAEWAKTVCAETEVVLSNGKKRIKSFQKIFALLVLVEKSSSICLFLQENVSDLDLPLATVRNRGSIELRRRDASGRPSSEVLNCFTQWSPVRKKEFEEYQWTMLAPFFTQGQYNNVKHYVLKEQHILPFVFTQNEEDDNAEFLGGFGRVFMVKIHPEHHNFRAPSHCDRGFAIKQLLQSDRLSFKREVDILKKFSGEKSHPHVVSLLATYEQFNKFHLVFYRAEGNLFQYWKEINSSPEFNYTNVLWMAKQCAGISHGLLRLHRHYTIASASSIPHYDKEEEFKRRSTGEKHVRVIDPLLQRKRENTPQSSSDQQVECASPTSRPAIFRASSERQAGLPRRPTGERPARLVNEPCDGDQVRQWGRHGDLKPENILLYHDGEDENGILRVSDFGEAELNSRWSKSKRRSKVANTITYRPPECDLQPKIIRQSYDIWSLGCVYMEFVTWMFGGVKLWKEFGRLRLAWDVFQSTKTDTFFEIVKNEDTDDIRVMVKDAVTKFFDKLHSHPNCTEYFHEFLDMIQHNMLVVEPSTVYKTRRMYCEEVSETLKEAYRKCCNDRDYATQKNPWAPKRLTAEPLTESVKINITDEAKEVITLNLPLLRPHYGPTGTRHS